MWLIISDYLEYETIPLEWSQFTLWNEVGWLSDEGECEAEFRIISSHFVDPHWLFFLTLFNSNKESSASWK
jgi:hypothetical protein